MSQPRLGLVVHHHGGAGTFHVHTELAGGHAHGEGHRDGRAGALDDVVGPDHGHEDGHHDELATRGPDEAVARDHADGHHRSASHHHDRFGNHHDQDQPSDGHHADVDHDADHHPGFVAHFRTTSHDHDVAHHDELAAQPVPPPASGDVSLTAGTFRLRWHTHGTQPFQHANLPVPPIVQAPQPGARLALLPPHRRGEAEPVPGRSRAPPSLQSS